jgi:carbon-monoxide dehydrogenase medium subunit
MPFIAHPQIRNRGTFGGSLAHGDPAAELPAVALALDAHFRLRRRGGQRWVSARLFYTGLFATALEPGELLIDVEIPPAPPRTGWSFQEFSRRHGDFALAGVAAGVTMDHEGRCASAVIAMLGLGERPTLAEGASEILAGAVVRDGVIDPSVVAEASRAAATSVEPWSDIHASADFKRHLAGVLVERALREATAEAAASAMHA